MNRTVIVRGARVIAWLVGAVFSGIGWYAVSVYGLANYDKAYGPVAIFQVGSAFALLFAIMGSVGYAVTCVLFGSHQPVWLAFAAGAVFAICMQCIAFGLGNAMPNGVLWLLAIAFSILLGGVTARFNQRNEA